MSYSAEYRLLISCGFEHDALVWSPFVKNLVFRLKGHHGALIGVKCVENTPELITADVHGVFKLWDVRKFECVQTFAANLSGTETKDNSRLCCFEYCNLKPRDARQKEDDSRIYCASKQVLSFDQARVVHAATTDKAMCFQLFWVTESCSFITVSERNVIVWDALIGSKLVANENMHHQEITAACLDSRKRKMVVGDALGHIYVYNHLNGQRMKTSSGKRNKSAVISLVYLDDAVRFIAGYADGLIRVFDEDPLEDCPVVRTFEAYKMHSELLMMRYCPLENTLVTAGALDGLIRMWDFAATKCEFESTVAGDRGSVVFVDFLFPLPIIVTSDSLCNIVLWGSRSTCFKNERICGFMNQTNASADLEPMKVMGDKEGDAPPRRSLAPTLDPALVEAEAELLAAYVEDTDKFLIDTLDKNVKKESESDCKRMITEAELRWGKPTAANCVSWDADSGLMFTADDMGVLRCFNLSKAIADVTWQAKPENWAANGGGGDGDVGDEGGEDGGEEGVTGEVQEESGAAEEAKAVEKEEKPRKESNALFSLNGSQSSQVDEEEEKDESQWHGRSFIRGFCRNRARTANSAVPPMPFRDKARETKYLVTGTNNPAGNHGVDFCWALQAHGDRIVSCLTNLHGCVTSGADMLVKMWTFGGEPLGVLMQSVPVGQRSQKWELMIDAEAIMKREDEELDMIIEQVEELTEDPELPNIYDMDFSAMEPGANAEDFTRSELRQRIGQTSTKLGIHFPVEGEDQDSEEEDIRSIAGGKSLSSALHELRSTRAKENKMSIQERREESDMTRKRREKKFEETSRKYEKLAGMHVGPPGSDSGVLDKDVDLKEIQALAGHGVDTSVEEQSEAKSNVSVAETSNQDLGESSVNFDDLASLVSSLGLPGSVQGVGDSINNQIGTFSQKGKRTQDIAKTCKKYDNWSKLEQALDASTKKVRSGVPPRPPKAPRK
jgi:WD40 repeat protein